MNEVVTHKNRVLILAPTGADAAVLRSMLTNNGLTPCLCGSINALCEGIDEISGTALIAEEAISQENIGRLVQTINRQPEWSDFPLIIMASTGPNPDRIWAILGDNSQLLNVSVMERPVLTRTLLAAVRSNLRSRNAQYRVAEELHRRKEAEKSLTAANEELQTFSYSVSHDLRAPLRTMQGFSRILIEDYGDKIDDTGQDYLNRIAKSTDQMGKLIDDILNLSKISRLEMSLQDVNLSALAQAIIDDFRVTQPQREVDIFISEELTARGDEHLLKIALTNLLGNAWKYTSKKQQSRIEFGSSVKYNETVFFVRDNGAGFSMEHAGKLFKPFQRLHSENEFSGTGIGLAIVHQVIIRHGGRIWAESEPGKGATFYFTLE
jgi:signal transduction histidine kinase